VSSKEIKMPEEQTEQKTGEENTVFVGTKPLMNYVASVIMQFTKNNSKEVIIKARGKFISKAVDIAEVVKKKFLGETKIEIKDIKINSAKFENKEGRSINISTIEIILIKK